MGCSGGNSDLGHGKPPDAWARMGLRAAGDRDGNQNAHRPERGCASMRVQSTFLRGHYPGQVRRSAAVSATLSARLPELPLRCYPVVEQSLRAVRDIVKRCCLTQLPWTPSSWTPGSETCRAATQGSVPPDRAIRDPLVDRRMQVGKASRKMPRLAIASSAFLVPGTSAAGRMTTGA
jgi:hypothetical protein